MKYFVKFIMTLELIVLKLVHHLPCELNLGLSSFLFFQKKKKKNMEEEIGVWWKKITLNQQVW